jgi:fibronectin-binding autotransporter adhesin
VDIQTAGTLDISQVTTSATVNQFSGAAGSNVALGSKTLIVANSSTTFSGTIGDGGILAGTGGKLTKTGGTIFTLAGANTYTGLTMVSGGTLQISGSIAGAALNSAGLILLNGGDVGGAITNNAAMTVNGAGGSTVGGLLTNDGTVSVTTTGTMVALGLTGTNAGATIDTTGAGAFAFGGDNAVRTYAGRFTGNGSVTKGGTGIQTLTGVNGVGAQFTGTFDIDGGALLVDGTLGDTAGNTATVNVNSCATLGGHGTVAGAVTVFSGGTLSAGASPGTLTVASLTLNAGSTSDFELGQAGVPGGGNNDLVQVGSTASLDGTLNLTAVGGGQVQSGYYQLMQVAGGATGHFATVNAGTATATTFVYTTTGGGANNVNTLVQGAGQFVQFWDGADETGAAGVAGGTGTWDGTRTNWTTNPDGSDPLAPGVTNPTINDSWREGVGIFAVTGGSVTTAATLNFQGLQFIVDGYTVNGPGALHMTGDAPGGTPARSFINVEGAGNTAAIAAVIEGDAGIGLSKAGAGTLVLSGANTYDGGTTITAGTLRLAGVGTLGAATASTTVDGASAVLDLGGTTQTQATVSLVDGAIQNGTLNATTLFDLQSGLVTGHLAGAAALVKSGAGTVTLSGANSYTGGTSVQAGTLVGDAASIRGDLTNNGTVVFNQAVDATFAGNIGGTGATVKGGLGALTLAGTSTLDWQVLAGGLTSAADRFTGDVAIGSGASFTFDESTDDANDGTI